MTVKEGAWPPGVPQDVKALLEQFYNLSNARSAGSYHDKGTMPTFLHPGTN